jgi:phage tail-like protein
MDANGLRFWMVSEAGQWHRPGDPPALEFDRGERHLRLASQYKPKWAEKALNSATLESEARSCLEKVPQARDRYGTRAFWDPLSQRILATGVVDTPTVLLVPARGEIPSDLVMGNDGVLYVALSGRVVLRDCRGRWPDVTLSRPECNAWRLAAHPTEGVWVLDRAHQTLWRIQGYPLAGLSSPETDPNRLCACEPNPHPPTLTRLDRVKLPADERAVAVASSPSGRLALLSWHGGEGRIRLLQPNGALGSFLVLSDSLYPWSLAWVSEERLAIRLVQAPKEAPVYALPVGEEPTSAAGLTVKPVGDFYPLQNADGPDPSGPEAAFVPGPFVQGPTFPPHYPSVARATKIESGRARSRRLRPQTTPLDVLPLPIYARVGRAFARSVFETANPALSDAPEQPSWDSGTPETIWHRLYLEAAIPATTGIEVLLAATDDLSPPNEWHEHRFGERFLPGDGQVPCGVWMPMASEVPFHPGVLLCPRQRNRSGLFTALVQRAGRTVRALQGRYLWVQVILSGDGQSTPALAALRVHASRFSYRDRYLPELYHETVFGTDRDHRSERSTPADFLERFLANCEGILTPLEDRIAHTYLLTSPRTTPPEALDWLGSWIGVTFDPAYPADRRRQLLARTPELYRRRGTSAGLELALDIATGGSVSDGAIIVLEDFRLRKTFATILGANLANQEDPLLAGLAVSGNSFVGDSLILGDETRKEFLALFKADLAGLDSSETEAITSFFEQLAYRATIYVHDQVKPQDLGLIRRIVDLETPAHVATQIVTASHPLLVGMASLVGIDTYLEDKPAPLPARVDLSTLGRDFVQSPASLDPRLGRGRNDWPVVVPPIAEFTGPEFVDQGDSFDLDARPSRASPGRKIARYRWQRLT